MEAPATASVHLLLLENAGACRSPVRARGGPAHPGSAVWRRLSTGLDPA
jgi:hypothetical protein